MTSAPVTDLKNIQPVSHRSGDTRKEMTHVHWQADIFTSHGLHAPAYIPTLYYPLSREQKRQKFLLSRPISLHSLCSTDLSGESPRYGSMSSSTTTKAIPHGYSRYRGPIESCRCQRAEGLAYICRPCSFIDHHCTTALPQRTIRYRFTANSICTGCNHNRSVFIDVPLGHLSTEQGSNQTAYATGPEGQYPHIYQHLRWKSPRCEHSRRASHRTRRFLRDGSRLSGLCQASHYLTSSGVLCNPGKVQFQMPQSVFSSYRPFNWSPVRPNNLLTGFYSLKDYPDKLRRVKYYDSETEKTLVFLTNNFSLPALTIAQLYRCRWQVELFFKWIKQNLRIKNFYGTSENAVKTQIWIAVSVYVLVAILKKRLNIPASLYTILQILSVSVFERTPLLQLLTETNMQLEISDSENQLNLFI